MNRQTAQWFLERVNAYLLTPELAQDKYQFSPQLFLEILKKGFGVDNLMEAKTLLEQIVQGLLAQVPDPEMLQYWQWEAEKRKAQNQVINEHVAKEIEAKIALAKKYRNIFQENIKELAVEPDTAGKVAWQLAESLAAQIDEEPTKLTLEEHSQFLTSSLPLVFEKAGCVVHQTSLTSIAQQLLKNTSPETTSFINARAAAVIKPESEPQIPEVEEIPQAQETIFVPEVKEKMAGEEEGVAFAPIYTVLNPPVAASFVKKVALAPVVKTLQFIDIVAGDQLQKEIAKDATKKGTILQWREKLHQGVNSVDLQESYDALSSAGVPQEAPQMKALEEKRIKMEEYEKAHPQISRLLDHYHQFTKITGRRQIFAKEIQAFLPRLSPAPGWFSKIGKTNFSLRLKRFFDGLGSHLFFYEKKTLVSGKTVIYFALPDKLTRLVTFGRVQSYTALKTLIANKTIKPLAAALGKTALGQTIKKGAAAILTKLGLAAIPTVVTQVIAVGWAAFDVLRALFSKKGREILKKILLVGLGVVLAIAGLLVAFPVGLIFFGLSFLAIGAVFISPVFLAGIISGVGGATSQAIGMIGGIIRLIPLSPLGTSFAAILIAVFSGIVALAFFIVMTTSAGFLGGGRGEATNLVGIGPSIDPRPPSEAGHLAENVIYTLKACGINKVYSTTWGQTVDCLRQSPLPNIETILGQFRYSVFSVGPDLQCVGFVRGVMAALGRDPGALGNAKDYLNQTPSGYYPPNRDMTEVQVGDTVIRTGSEFGHMGIVVGLETKDGLLYMRVAQAFGNLQGQLEITYERNIFYNGFLRPR